MESCVWRSTDAPATAEDSVLGEEALDLKNSIQKCCPMETSGSLKAEIKGRWSPFAEDLCSVKRVIDGHSIAEVRAASEGFLNSRRTFYALPAIGVKVSRHDVVVSIWDGIPVRCGGEWLCSARGINILPVFFIDLGPGCAASSEIAKLMK
jgi:hypothetical protein